MHLILFSGSLRAVAAILLVVSTFTTVSCQPAVSPPSSDGQCIPACANGGLCELLANGSSLCNCDNTGHTGRWCSISQDTAAWGRANNRLCNPTCVNGGNCLKAQNGGFECECSGTGFTGEDCRTPDETPFLDRGIPAPPAPNATSNNQTASISGTEVADLQGSGINGWGVAIILLVIGLSLVVMTGLVILFRRRRNLNTSEFERFEQRPSVEFYATKPVANPAANPNV